MTWERTGVRAVGHNNKVHVCTFLVYKQAEIDNFYFYFCADSLTGAEILLQGHI